MVNPKPVVHMYMRKSNFMRYSHNNMATPSAIFTEYIQFAWNACRCAAGKQRRKVRKEVCVTLLGEKKRLSRRRFSRNSPSLSNCLWASPTPTWFKIAWRYRKKYQFFFYLRHTPLGELWFTLRSWATIGFSKVNERQRCQLWILMLSSLSSIWIKFLTLITVKLKSR